MSQESCHRELREKTQQLLQGALKHVRSAALAAALVPLGAVVAVSPAMAQTQDDCFSDGFPTGAPGCVYDAPAVPSPCDFVTSGGFVVTDSAARANFGAHGGCKKGAFSGHVNYVDHSDGLHVTSVGITGYLTPVPGSNTRDICGMATTNRAEPQPVRFRVRLIDNGGTGDGFGIRLSNGYWVTTRFLGGGGPGGGNVDLHAPNPSTVGPNPAPTEADMCGGVLAP